MKPMGTRRNLKKITKAMEPVKDSSISRINKQVTISVSPFFKWNLIR